MRVVIAGGSGFLGTALTRALADMAPVTILTRQHPAPRGDSLVRYATWDPTADGPWRAELDGADAVINLAGESIAARRWSEAQKRRILDSRVQATRSLAA